MREFMRMGGVSFLLTLLNIVIIVAVALLMFYVKRVHWGRKIWRTNRWGISSILSGVNRRESFRKSAPMRSHMLGTGTTASAKLHGVSSNPAGATTTAVSAGTGAGTGTEAAFWQVAVQEYRSYNDTLNAKSTAAREQARRQRQREQQQLSPVAGKAVQSNTGSAILDRLPSFHCSTNTSVGNNGGTLPRYNDALHEALVPECVRYAEEQAHRPSVFELMHAFEAEERARGTRDALMAAQIDSAVNSAEDSADARARQTRARVAMDSADTAAGVHAVSRHSVGRLLVELQANAAAELDHQVQAQDLIDARESTRFSTDSDRPDFSSDCESDDSDDSRTAVTIPKKTMPPSPENLV
jgi:hypothetical protein